MKVQMFQTSFLIIYLLIIQNHVFSKSTSRKKSSTLKNTSSYDQDDSNEIIGDKKLSKGGRMKGPIPRNVITPRKKEAITTKAIRGFEGLGRTLRSTAETVISTSKKAQRELKALISSDFENLLLKLTRPDNSRSDDEDIERMLLTIESFSRNMNLIDEANPYRITLHKIWIKIVEKDEKTVLKALFLFHVLLRSTESEDAAIFRALILRMSREICVKTNSKYFQLLQLPVLSKSKTSRNSKTTSKKQRRRLLGDTDSDSSTRTQRDGEPETTSKKTLVTSYANYCLKRGASVTAGFEELALVGAGTRAEDIATQFSKAIKLMDLILECTVLPEGDWDEPTALCYELLGRDLSELFQLFDEKLDWLVEEKKTSTGGVFEGWSAEEVEKTMKTFQDFRTSRLPVIRDYLKKIGTSLEEFDISIPPISESTPL